MKLIKSRIPRTRVTVGVLGGYTVHFEKYQAVVPDVVANVLLAHSNYTDEGSVGDAVRNARVLVVRDAGMGDVLLTTPLIRKLVTEKGASVDVLTSERYRCLFDGNPHVGQTFSLDNLSADNEAVLFAGYDVLLDLRLVVENAEAAGIHEHRADAFAQYGDVELTEIERRPDLFLSDDEKQKAERYRRVFMEGGRIGMVGYVWNSSTSNRNWSEATHNAVVAAIEAAGYGVLLLGDEWRRLDNRLPSCGFGDDCHVIDLMGETDVREAAAIMGHCDVVISPDTGLFHVAAALDIPTLTYFGAFPVAERAAHISLVVLNDISVCSLGPCRSYRCFNRDENHQPVCLSVSPVDVVNGVKALAQTIEKRDVPSESLAVVALKPRQRMMKG